MKRLIERLFSRRTSAEPGGLRLANRRFCHTWICCLIALLLLGLAFLPGAVFAQGRTVRMGIYQNEPKVFMNTQGKASGFFVDLFEKIAAREGWTPVYVPCEWQACLQALQAGSIDLMPDVAYSTERETQFDFPTIPVIESWSRVYASPDAKIIKFSDMNGKRIAVLQGSVQQTVLQQLMDGFGYKVNFVIVDSFDQAFTLTASGKADAAVANHMFGDYFYQKFGLTRTSIDFDPVSLYYVTAKGRNHDLLEGIDRDLKMWIAQPDSPYYSTLGNWSPAPEYRIPDYVYWAGGGILGLLVIAVGMIFLLRQQVNLRTSRLMQASVELKNSEQRYQTLAQISPVGIFQTDAEGSTTYVNPKWSAISGLSLERALGNAWLEAVHPDDREKLDKGWQESAQQHRASYSDYRFVHPDGSIAWVMGQAVPEKNEENQIIGYVGTITDITERKLAEEEIKNLNTDLEKRVHERTAQLEAANKELESFSYSVSHDLRAPLRAISGFSSIIARRYRANLNDEGRHYFDNIVLASDRMGQLIDDLLTYARIGRAGIRREPVSLANLLGEIEHNMQEIIAAKQGSLIIRDPLPVIKSDHTLLSQVFTNILENAFKYHKNDIPPQVIICSREEGNYVVIEISDNGIGIPQEYLEKIFNVFQRLHSEEQYPGTGIGLATVKKSVELLRGAVWVKSQPNEGSTFFVRLPKE